MKNKLAFHDQFITRHQPTDPTEIQEMLQVVKADTLQTLVDETVPPSIRLAKELHIPEAVTEFELLKELQQLSEQNRVFRSYIGQGYHNTITPSPILRNVFQNPGWYTQYTPYQAEIAQGRLEALLNFQTVVADLTGLPIANASLLDEGTAAAEAMLMFFGIKNKRAKDNPANQFFVDQHTFPQTLDILQTRAEPMGVEIIVGDWNTFEPSDKTFGVFIQFPNAQGALGAYQDFCGKLAEAGVFITVGADLLSLTLLSPPGEWGADAVVGNTQRLGVPLGFGGPHAAYFATKDKYKRQIPGRIIGISLDRHGNQALRMALQTREQHIRREKATSNICTAQALLAIMASMYAVYHGPDGLKAIAERIHSSTQILAKQLERLGHKPSHSSYFDTLHIPVSKNNQEKLLEIAEQKEINFYYADHGVQISLDETTLVQDLEDIVEVFASFSGQKPSFEPIVTAEASFPPSLVRTSEYLTHPVFSSHRTETKIMRYIKRLENKDLSLVHSMIPLGSCTMKLNAASELIPVSFSGFANIHPFVPSNQVLGYLTIFERLEAYLSEITGFDACSLQPNSGAQGEYSGLLTIRAYHLHHGNKQRDIVLIPSSAHGTNPASAVMVGMKVVVVATDEKGNIDLEDLREKAHDHKANLAALMVTYPSTHGVFEVHIKTICDIIHENGGLVYMDGANMNAQVGLTNPAKIGADVCHLNLHKTFAIPHGGGGPGMGPICVNHKLSPFLPGHVHFEQVGGSHKTRAVSAAPWGSASILLISYAYIRMLGKTGLKEATKIAILNANYIKSRLEDAYPVLYLGDKGRSAHELILDLRQFKDGGVSAEDVAKRLIDFGFHAPTLSFPVAGTIMIEPTESESKEELDRFCEAMLKIREEIEEVLNGTFPPDDNVLVNAPHTVAEATSNAWTHPYDREKAVYPLPYLREGFKFWAPVARVNNAHGDRNLICTCPPIEAYATME